MNPSKKQLLKERSRGGKVIKSPQISPAYKHDFTLAILVAITGFLLYANTISHKYVLDDFSVIRENFVTKQGLQGIPTIFKTSYRYGYWNDVGTLYRPLSLMMFAIEWHFFPDQPSVSHGMNVLLYACTGLILFLLLRKLLIGRHPFIAFATALLFIAHPVHTEVVANIKSRDEILCFLFVLLSAMQLFNFATKGSKLSLFFSSIFFFLAFMSKESAIVYLAIFPLLLYFFTGMALKKIIFSSSLFIIPALLYIVIRRGVLGSVAGAENVDVVDNLLVGAPDKIHQVATAVKILGKYILLLIFPNSLSCDYSYNQIPINGLGDAGAIFSFLFYMGIGVFALIRLPKKDILSFSILFYLITFSLFSNILILIGSSFGERFVYHSSFGFVLAIMILLSMFFKTQEKSPDHHSPPTFGTGLALTATQTLLRYVNPGNIFLVLIPAILFTAYSAKTFSRNRDWKDNYSLYAKDVKTCSNSARTHYYYALELVQSKALKTENKEEKMKFFDMAIDEFSRAIEIYPPYSDAYDQRGLAWFRKGENDKALASYESALKYNPNKATTLSNMGAIYFNKGDFQKAMECYKKAVAVYPRYADAWLNLGSTYATFGKFREALDAYLQSLKYDNENPMVYYYLGITYQKVGDEANARNYLETAYRMKPELRK